jgi:hypothetical protein
MGTKKNVLNFFCFSLFLTDSFRGVGSHIALCVCIEYWCSWNYSRGISSANLAGVLMQVFEDAGRKSHAGGDDNHTSTFIGLVFETHFIHIAIGNYTYRLVNCMIRVNGQIILSKELAIVKRNCFIDCRVICGWQQIEKVAHRSRLVNFTQFGLDGRSWCTCLPEMFHLFADPRMSPTFRESGWVPKTRSGIYLKWLSRIAKILDKGQPC